MKILHYALGFPPYRTGGLTKFCMDLMKQQNKDGHQVAMMWPGQMGFINHKVTIKERSSISGIQSFEVINPLPISFDEGIIDMDAFTAVCDPKIYVDILSQIKPDVIHIHALMGLHMEFLNAAKDLSIRTVFSVHDFFAICPKVTMFRNGMVCTTVNDCSACPQCNLTALSYKKILILQSPIYRMLKDSAVSKKLRKRHRDQYLSGKAGEEVENTERASTSPSDYKRLRNYYGQMILRMDMVHYNSSVTKNVFEQSFHPNKSVIISISHADIRDNRKIQLFGDNLRLTYLGPQSDAKGYFVLKEALDQLWRKKQNFSLSLFFTPAEMSPYMKVHGRYSYADLEEIFDETDILVAPSIWYETFGYTVLEALSFGVPVIVSENVGAKDVIPEGCGIVLKNNSADTIVKCISSLSKDMLRNMNKMICCYKTKIETLKDMNRNILKELY